MTILNLEIREAVLKTYVTQLARACRVLGVPIREVEYNERELRLALDECDLDIQALFKRRSARDGISPGKIAGVLAFRLSRFKIVHVLSSGHCLKGAYLVAEVAALYLVEAIILRVGIPSRAFMELSYQLCRRHANQETLGVCFDVVHGDHEMTAQRQPA